MKLTDRNIDRRRPVAVVDETSSIHRPARGDRDGDLVEQLRQREAGAVEALVGAYGDRAYRLAMRITGSRPDAEEAVQDTLMAVTRKIDTFRGAAAFGSWIYRITANAAYQKLRERRNERNAMPSDEHGRSNDPALETELRVVLRAAINELPEDHRVAVLLHDVEGRSSPEIARTLRLTPGAVKSRLHRARRFLRDRLAGWRGIVLR